MNNNDAVDAIAQSIIFALENQIGIFPFDKTVKGTIKQIKTEGYQVELLGSLYNIKDKNTYTVGTKVWVTIPCNDYSDMFILKERSE